MRNTNRPTNSKAVNREVDAIISEHSRAMAESLNRYTSHKSAYSKGLLANAVYILIALVFVGMIIYCNVHNIGR